MTKNNSINRRHFLTGSGAVLAAGSLSSGRAVAATPSANYALTPVLDTVDVLVVGGGPAGIAAMLAAQGQGVKCLLVESYSFFGGSAVWGLGKPMEQMRLASKPRSVIHEKLLKHLTDLGSQAARLEGANVHPNVHFLKAAIVDALDEAKCSYYVHVQAADAVVEGKRVTGVILATKQGLKRVNAKVVLDCTGDASIVSLAGAATLSEGSASAPMALSAAYIDMDVPSVKTSDITQAFDRARGKYPLLPKTVKGLEQVSTSGFGTMNHSGTSGFGSFDPLDPKQRSEAECKSRRQVLQMEHAMRASSTKALQDIDICEGAPQVCVPLPRRVKGVYTLTQQDVANGASFPDTIALRHDKVNDGHTRCGIPYRAMIPERLDGILNAGSGISAARGAVSTAAGNCMATGHAAGLAAALSVKQGIMPRELKVTEIQDALRKDEVDLIMGGKV
ncbi:FAD-dependent oxidoreductase [Planctomycetota bacterium]